MIVKKVIVTLGEGHPNLQRNNWLVKSQGFSVPYLSGN